MTDNIVAIIVFGIVIILTFVLPYAFHVQEKTHVVASISFFVYSLLAKPKK